MATPKTPNLLEESGRPLFYPISSDDHRVPEVPDLGGHDVAVRSLVRSLTVMQKEAVVTTSASPISWRLSSDEGPYLNGHDFAPAPLAVAAAGFTAEQMERIHAATGATPAVALDTHYTMEGSMLRGTMIGGANPPEVTVAGADLGAVLTAVNASAIAGLAGPSHTSLFSLTCHGREIPVGRVAAEMITPYPPGIPAVLPGERLKQPVLEYLRTGVEAGMNLPDAADPGHLMPMEPCTGRYCESCMMACLDCPWCPPDFAVDSEGVTWSNLKSLYR